jgi:hypothetical protein
VLLFYAVTNSGATPSAPAGWELVQQQANSTTVSGYVFGRVSDGTEHGTNVTLSGLATHSAGFIQAWANCDVTTPTIAAGGSWLGPKSARANASGTKGSTSVTPLANTCVVLLSDHVLAGTTHNTWLDGNSNAMTEGDADGGDGTVSICNAFLLQTAKQATGVGTWSQANNGAGVGMWITLVPVLQAPTLVSYQETASWATSPGAGVAKTVPITWQTGDVVVVIGLNGGGTGTSWSAVTCPGLSFTTQKSLSGSSTVDGYISAASAPAAAPGTSQNVSMSVAAVTGWGMGVWVWRGSDGVGNSADTPTPSSSTKTASLATAVHSAVCWGFDDFGSSATLGTIVPTPTDTRQRANISNNTIYVADLIGQTSSPTSYGLSGSAGVGPWQGVATEVVGTASVGPAGPTVTAELWESGSFVASLGVVQITAESTLSLTWDASLLSDPSGAGVELRLTTDVGADIGAIEWLDLYAPLPGGQITDTLTTADVAIRTVHDGQAVTESLVTGPEVAGRSTAPHRGTSDTHTPADASARTAARTVATSDSLSTSDTANRQATNARTVRDQKLSPTELNFSTGWYNKQNAIFSQSMAQSYDGGPSLLVQQAVAGTDPIVSTPDAGMPVRGGQPVYYAFSFYGTAADYIGMTFYEWNAAKTLINTQNYTTGQFVRLGQWYRFPNPATDNIDYSWFNTNSSTRYISFGLRVSSPSSTADSYYFGGVTLLGDPVTVFTDSPTRVVSEPRSLTDTETQTLTQTQTWQIARPLSDALVEVDSSPVTVHLARVAAAGESLVLADSAATVVVGAGGYQETWGMVSI